MSQYHELRKKYPKWAHRRDEHKKRRRKSRQKRRRARKRARKAAGTSTEGMLVSLLHQLMLKPATLAKKHGDNVLTGYANVVDPDTLAANRSRAWYQMKKRERDGRPGGAGAGAGAAAAIGNPMQYGDPRHSRHRSPSPQGNWRRDRSRSWN